MMLALVTSDDQALADEADLYEVYEALAEVIADLGLAYLLACSSGADDLAADIHAAMMLLSTH